MKTANTKRRSIDKALAEVKRGRAFTDAAKRHRVSLSRLSIIAGYLGITRGGLG